MSLIFQTRSWLSRLHFKCACVCVCMLSHSVAAPWTVAHQAPLSMEFSRHEYWSRLPFPPPGHLLDPGIKLHLLRFLQADSLPLAPPGKPVWECGEGVYNRRMFFNSLCCFRPSTVSEGVLCRKRTSVLLSHFPAYHSFFRPFPSCPRETQHGTWGVKARSAAEDFRYSETDLLPQKPSVSLELLWVLAFSQEIQICVAWCYSSLFDPAGPASFPKASLALQLLTQYT